MKTQPDNVIVLPDVIERQLEEARTVKEYEQADAAFLALPLRVRRKWLEKQAEALGIDPDDLPPSRVTGA